MFRRLMHGSIFAHPGSVELLVLRHTVAAIGARQLNTAATAEPSRSGINHRDKFLYYSDAEGYIKTSPYKPVAEVNLTVDKFVWQNCKDFQNRVATLCIVSGRQYTYAELRDSSAAFAVRLQTKFKLGRGDILAICLPNVPEFPIAFLGAIEAGLVVTTMNPIYTAEEIGRQLTLSNTKFIVGTFSGFDNLKKACKLAQKDLPIVVLGVRPDDVLPAGAINFLDIINPQGVDYSQLTDYDIDPKTLACLPFSSGTTGMPKGVQLSHNNVTINCLQGSAPFDYNHSEQQEVLPAVLPLFHIFGLGLNMLSKLNIGAKLITMPQFKPDDLIKTLDEHRATILILVPPIALFMINYPKLTAKTVPTLKYVVSGAAPIGENDVDRFLKKFPNTEFLQGFGMTETSPVVLSTKLGNTRHSSTGFLLPNTEAKFVDMDAKDYKGLGPNVTGELCIRGPQVMMGYLNNDEANANIFYPNGWLRTGDVGFYDDEGYFYITDRMKELIKVKGFQVPPAELEAILRDHPKILEAAVIPFTDAAAGELPRAIVALRKDMKATESEIYDYVADRVAEYKKLDGGIIFVPEVLKSPTGKIMRKVLREKYSN